MQSIYEQFVAFSVTIGIGFLAGILFDFYRVIRGLWKPRQLGTFLGDLIFWVIMTVLVFTLLLIGNWADLRIYVFLGIFLGLYFYINKFSKKVQYCFRKLLVLILQGIAFLWRVLSWPFKFISKIFSRIFSVIFGFIATGFLGIGKFFQSLYRKTSNRLRQIFSKKPKDDE